MKMDSNEMPLCSQTFFVSQRSRDNKLSLTSKSMNKSKDIATNRGRSKYTKSQGPVRGRPRSALNSRRGGKGAHFITMDKYLGGRSKETETSCSQLENENDEPSTSGVSGGESDLSDAYSLPANPSEDSMLKIDKDRPLNVNYQKTGDGNFGSDCGSALEAQIPEISLHNDEQCASSDGESTLYVQNKDKADLLMCPLCWKYFECKDSQTTHMKLCAIKHNVTTKQLLNALELVQRQEAERKSLGLPLLASRIFKSTPKKESSITQNSSIKPKTASDGFLQLGLALSESLLEAEKEKERNHLLEAGLVEEANEKGLLPTQEISLSQPAKPAPIFLNIGKRSGDEPKDISKVRRRNVKYGFRGKVPAILRRTIEERERLITEKVAIILVGDDTGISGKSVSLGGQGSIPAAWEVRSKEIKKYIDKENIWWTLAGASPSSVSQKQYYVDSLASFISPSKIVAGAKLKHLSQIPGRNNTPNKSSSLLVNDIVEDVAVGCMLPFSNIPGPTNPQSSKKPTVKRNLFCQSPKVSNTPNPLSRDWNLLIGKKEMSDLTIFTQEDYEIPAHKLVFYVRCPSVLKDVVKEERRDNEPRDMLIWNEVYHLAVKVFLKFIYCGELGDISTVKDFVINDLKELAIRYHLNELQMALNNAISLAGDRETLSEKTNMVSMADIQIAKHAECTPAQSEGDHLDYPTVLPKAEDCEKLSFCNPGIMGLENKQQLAVESSANKKDDDFGDVHQNSITPSSCVPAVNSPDIFHCSSLNSPVLTDSNKNINDIHIISESCDDSNFSQSSRSSIDYLVSLMEKESESSGNNIEAQVSVPNQIKENSLASEAFNHLNKSVDWAKMSECKTPKTQSLVDKTSELIMYPSPAPSEKIPFKGEGEISTSKDANSFKDCKRKLVMSDSSDSSTPTKKKFCLLEGKESEETNSSISLDEREVIDLTQNSDSEEAAKKENPNFSDVPAITSPAKESCIFVEEKEISNSYDSIPNENSYISNVWDDFDHISDGGYLAHGDAGLDSKCVSSESIPVKDSEEPSSVSIIGERCQKRSLDNNSVVNFEVPGAALRDSADCNTSLRNDKEENMDSSIHEEFSLAGNDVDGCDITEKLLNVSLQKINESIFWRDENEPVEGNSKNKDTPVTPKTPLQEHACVTTSKKDTPINSGGYKFIRSANVTPIADFSSMKTPTLHKELDRYGIKHLKRNQAKKILRHIYNELHPVISPKSECKGNSTNSIRRNEVDIQHSSEKQNSKESKEKIKVSSKNFDLSSDEDSSSEDSSDSSSDSVILEESMCDQMQSPVKDITLSQKACAIDIPTGMKILIERNPTLHKKILLYEPVWLNEIKLALKEVGAKFNANQLMNYLDEKCITFRLASGNRHRRRRGPKEKSVSLSQPCNSRAKGYDTMSSSQPC